MPTCDKGDFQSSVHGQCNCIADNTYLCADGQKLIDTGSSASTEDIIRAQDRARAEEDARRMKMRLPWIGAGAVVLGYFIWRKRR